MADASDVSAALVTLISGLLYPSGTTSAAGPNVRVYPGWPVPEQLDSDLANRAGNTPAPICHVSVWPLPTERNTTRYLAKFQQTSINTPTLTLNASGQTATVGGTIPPASNVHNLAVFVNKVPYVYQALPTDTLSSIAAALAARIPGAIAAGAVIAIPSSATLGPVRVGTSGTSSRPVRNQERAFQITIWADSPAHRDAIAKVIDPALAATPFLSFTDGSAGRLIYRSSPFTDMQQKMAIYRRDLMYSVDFSTLQTVTAPQIVAVETDWSVAVSGVPPYVPVATEFN
jgi:hypothetical protein